jgi:predicted nucleic acid-binding protein
VAASQQPVVSNTTPVINLVGVGHLDVLPALYGTVTIADVVRDEYVAGKSTADPNLDSLSWLQIVSSAPLDPSLPPQLGAGERATLSLASALAARAVLLDEAYGRRLARSRGLPVVGTLGVLLAAKQAGHLGAIKPIVEEMIRQGRRISQRLMAQVLRAAGE